MKNKQKGFTLIELLIVVAIIGILAAVGAVVIPGVLGGAKEKTTTSNHKAISDWVQVQFTQCSLGEANLIYTSNASGGTTTVACTTNAAGHNDAIINHLKFQNYNNPYNTSEQAAYKSTSSSPPEGRTHINCSGDVCQIYTTVKAGSVLSASVTKQ